MTIWKELTADDLNFNRNDLDVRKMYKAGAIQQNGKYRALEVDRNEKEVTVLARLEVGFEEYIVFQSSYYKTIPEVVFQQQIQ